MSTCTHRERVIEALNHREPDRVPIDLMGHASMLLDETYERLRDFLGLSPILPIRSGFNANYYDERVLEYLDVDFRRLFLKSHPQAQLEYHPDGSYTDVWGIRSDRLGVNVHVVGSPLRDATTVAEVEAFQWPSAQQMFVTDGLAAEAQRLYEQTDYALVARNPLSYGFRERACMLMGMQEFMMALKLFPAAAQCIIDHLLAIYKDVYGMFLDAVGPYVHTVEVGDDLGGTRSLLISPAMYRRYFKPAERELYDLVHAKAPNAKLVRHSDGAFFQLIPDLIEIGVDVLNPVQTSAQGMDADTLKSTFGQQLAFHGGIESVEGDVPVEVVVAEVKNRIDILGRGGGYVVSSCNHMMDVRPENIIAMFETAREYGQYR